MAIVGDNGTGEGIQAGCVQRGTTDSAEAGVGTTPDSAGADSHWRATSWAADGCRSGRPGIVDVIGRIWTTLGSTGGIGLPSVRMTRLATMKLRIDTALL